MKNPATSSAPAVYWPPKIGWGVMFLLALLMFLIASRYLTFNPEVYFPEQKLVYIAHTAGIITHIVGAMVATILGPFQFLPQLRTGRYINIHRWTGRLYLLGILTGGLAGLYMAFLAYGGLMAQLGFGTLAVLWLSTSGLAYYYIRQKEVNAHQQWMIRSYALTFAAVTLRLWLMILPGLGLEFVDAYRTVAWLCWIPNLLVAEWLVRRLR